MKHSIAIAALLVTFGAMSGCDAKVDENYAGESLMRISGTVVMPESEAGNDYIPAIAFFGNEVLSIMDVVATGEFPAKFTLDLTTPPPETVMREIDAPDAPEFAVGYITAVEPDAPRHVDLYDILWGRGASITCSNPFINVDPSERRKLLDQPEELIKIARTAECYREVELYLFDGTHDSYTEYDDSQRYRQKASCTWIDGATGLSMSFFSELVCNDVVEQSGNPQVLEQILGGCPTNASRNFVLIYLSKEIPAGAIQNMLDSDHSGEAVVLQRLFGDAPVTAGYHLIQIQGLTAAKLKQAYSCMEALYSDVFEAFNAEYGTEFASIEDFIDFPYPPGSPEATTLMDLFNERMMETNCVSIMSDSTYEDVETPSETPLTIIFDPYYYFFFDRI